MQIEPSPVRVDELTALKKSETAGSARESVDVGQPTVVQRSQPKTPVRSLQPGPSSLLAGRYLLVPPYDGTSMHSCIDATTKEEYACRIVGRENSGLLEAHYRVDGEKHVNSLSQVVVGKTNVYLMFSPSYGDLHMYVRARRRLREPEARRLFKQVAQAVCACHQAGLVLRDVKLRKFVFADPDRTELKLESLEDAVVLSDESDDVLQDKRGCPAYVSPEILRSHARYSGRAADVWSLGVILYTMLVGRYPFNDSEHISLFWKISRGQFVMPDSISPQAKCLIRSLLRREPSERLTSSDVLLHPWFQTQTRCYHQSFDQIVPDSAA